MDGMQRITDRFAKLSPAWRWSITIWLAARIILTLWPLGVWAVGVPFMPNMDLYYELEPITGGLAEPLLGFWQRWDAIHYQRIVENGYAAVQSTVFFPLFPLLGAALVALTGMNSLLALMIISNLATLVALKVIYELVEEDYGLTAARGATVAALLLPTSFFLFAPFPNALSLMLIVLAYQAARRRRFFTASLYGLATGLSHGTGVPLAILLGYEVFRALRQPGRKLVDWVLLAVPFTPLMGTALFMAWRYAAGFPSYAWVQEEFWKRGLQWPWVSLMRMFNAFQNAWYMTSGWSDLVLFLLTIAALIWGWKRLKREQWWFLVATVVLMFSAPDRKIPLVGYGRYALIMFPFFTVLATWFQNMRHKRLVIVPALLSQFLLMSLYYLWLWVD